MTSTMGRRRQSNLDLPPRMHLKSGTYYYVTTDKPRKWISLGKDLNEARRKWADIEAGPVVDFWGHAKRLLRVPLGEAPRGRRFLRRHRPLGRRHGSR